jgi:hypothetical protein
VIVTGHVFRPLAFCCVHAVRDRSTTRALDQVETQPPGRWRNACVARTPAPQPKPVTRPRAAWRSRAVGGFRAGLSVPNRRASSRTTLLLCVVDRRAMTSDEDDRVPRGRRRRRHMHRGATA